MIKSLKDLIQQHYLIHSNNNNIVRLFTTNTIQLNVENTQLYNETIATGFYIHI